MPKKNVPAGKIDKDEQRNLDIEIEFMEGLVRRDPGYVSALRVLGDDYTRRGRIEEGLHVDKQLARLCPEDPGVHYNLACSYSLVGQCDLAMDVLDHALNLGYRDFSWLMRDPDLKNVRKHPLYKILRNKMRSLTQSEL